MANVTAGAMPPGGAFKGVWYSEAFGELHLVTEGANIVGKWKDKTHGRWGKMSGTVDGDLAKFRWEEHKMGAIGPGSTTLGRGYFKFMPAEEGALPRLKGEWGYEENEVGGGNWDMNRVQDREPNLNEVKSDEDPTVDSGWDADPKKNDKKLAPRPSIQGCSPPSIQACKIACCAAVRHAALPTSLAGSPVQPAPGGIVPFWIRSSMQAPLLLPPHEAALACSVAKLLTFSPPLAPLVWQGPHFDCTIGSTSSA